jgi:hypothetical protein
MRRIKKGAPCGALISKRAETFIAYLSAIAACATAEAGLGLLARAGAISLGVKDHSDSRAAESNCRVQYPGPRRWNTP